VSCAILPGERAGDLGPVLEPLEPFSEAFELTGEVAGGEPEFGPDEQRGLEVGGPSPANATTSCVARASRTTPGLSIPVDGQKTGDVLGSPITSRPSTTSPGLAWTWSTTPASWSNRLMYQAQPAEATTTAQPDERRR
jgi:hypothetical protein